MKQLFSLSALQVYQVIRFFTTFSIGILLAKVFGLKTVEIALYEVVLFLGNFVSFFWISAAQKNLLSLFPTFKKEEQGKFLFNLFLLLLVFAFSAALLLFFGQRFLLRALTQYETIDFLYLISLYIFFNAPAQLIEYVYVLEKQPKRLLIYGISIHFLQLIAIIIPLVLGLGVSGIFQYLVVWSFLKFLWLLTIVWQYGAFEVDKPLLRRILWFLLPLCLHMLIGSGMEYIDGFLVTKFIEDKQQFAIYRYGARELPFVNMIIAALVATTIPLAIENEQKALKEAKQKIKGLSIWMYALSIALMLSSPYLFPLVYNDEFVASAKIFNIYLLIIISRILIPQVLLYSRQHINILVYSAIIELCVNWSLSIYLLDLYGLEGIAFATVIAYLVNKAILIAYVYKYFDIRISDYLAWKDYLLFNTLLLLAFWWSI